MDYTELQDSAGENEVDICQIFNKASVVPAGRTVHPTVTTRQHTSGLPAIQTEQREVFLPVKKLERVRKRNNKGEKIVPPVPDTVTSTEPVVVRSCLEAVAVVSQERSDAVGKIFSATDERFDEFTNNEKVL